MSPKRSASTSPEPSTSRLGWLGRLARSRRLCFSLQPTRGHAKHTPTDILGSQADAGAQVVQIFDSWASELQPQDFDVFSGPYIQKVIDSVRKTHPDLPIILYISGELASVLTGSRSAVCVAKALICMRARQAQAAAACAHCASHLRPGAHAALHPSASPLGCRHQGMALDLPLPPSPHPPAPPAGSGGLLERMAACKPDIISLDQSVDFKDGVKRCGPTFAYQVRTRPAP
jgi:hypothetical protein